MELNEKLHVSAEKTQKNNQMVTKIATRKLSKIDNHNYLSK